MDALKCHIITIATDMQLYDLNDDSATVMIKLGILLMVKLGIIIPNIQKIAVMV